MPAYCKRCSLHIPDGVASCRMCGSTVLTTPPSPAEISDLETERSKAAQPGFSKWLFFVGLSLIVAPELRAYAIVEVEIPALFSDKGRELLAQHPGLDKLFSFEICMNVLLVVAALALNYLFYTRSKYFPKSMVAYVAVTFAYRLAVIGIVHSLNPDTILAHSAYSLVRYFIWCAALAGYLLLNSDVENRFGSPAPTASVA